MSRLLILKGLPASGKTHIACELEKQGWKVVEKDRIREDTGKKNEKAIIRIRDSTIQGFLINGVNVVSSDTNLHPTYVPCLVSIGEECGAEVEVRFIDTPVNVCILRDKEREKTIGAGIIVGMYNKYIRENVCSRKFTRITMTDEERIKWTDACTEFDSNYAGGGEYAIQRYRLKKPHQCAKCGLNTTCIIKDK